MESFVKVLAAFSVICGLAYALYRIYDRKFIHDQLKPEFENNRSSKKYNKKIEFYGCDGDMCEEDCYVFGDEDCDVDFSDYDNSVSVEVTETETEAEVVADDEEKINTNPTDCEE